MHVGEHRAASQVHYQSCCSQPQKSRLDRMWRLSVRDRERAARLHAPPERHDRDRGDPEAGHRRGRPHRIGPHESRRTRRIGRSIPARQRVGHGRPQRSVRPGRFRSAWHWRELASAVFEQPARGRVQCARLGSRRPCRETGAHRCRQELHCWMRAAECQSAPLP